MWDILVLSSQGTKYTTLLSPDGLSDSARTPAGTGTFSEGRTQRFNGSVRKVQYNSITVLVASSSTEVINSSDRNTKRWRQEHQEQSDLCQSEQGSLGTRR